MHPETNAGAGTPEIHGELHRTETLPIHRQNTENQISNPRLYAGGCEETLQLFGKLNAATKVVPLFITTSKWPESGLGQIRTVLHVHETCHCLPTDEGGTAMVVRSPISLEW